MKNGEIDLSKDAQTFSRRDALRIFGGAGLGVLLANTSPIAAQTKLPVVSSAQKENLQGAGFYRFKIGAFDCTAVSDGLLKLPPDAFFNAPKAEIQQVLRDNFLPIDQLTLHINTLVVKTGRSVVLMDTGGGKSLGATAGFLPVNLQRAGIAPAEITDIVFSHAHFDHIGGTIGEAGKFNYPNARYHVSQTEWEAAMNPQKFIGEAKADEALLKAIFDSIKQNFPPLKERLALFKTETEIVPGITAMPAFGHTPGHAVYAVKSGGESLLFTGDLIHHAAVQFARPEWSMFGDSSPQTAIARRRQILDRVVVERLTMMGSHFPFPGIGHVRARDAKRTSYEWIPLEWQW